MIAIVMSNILFYHMSLRVIWWFIVRDGDYLPIAGAWVHPQFLVGSMLLIFFVFCVVSLLQTTEVKTNRNNETDIIRNIPIKLLFNIYLRVYISNHLNKTSTSAKTSCLHLIMIMRKKNNVRQQSCDCRLRVITKNIYDNSWHFRICFQENRF
jgi:hypothetical protein